MSSPMFDKRAVFLDRDGTLVKAIRRPEFIKKITAPFRFGEFAYMEGAQAAIRSFKQMGFLTIIITNQPDVSLGYMERKEWQDIHNKVIMELMPDDFFMCRHASIEGWCCNFKKPSPLMLFVAADKWGIDLERSYMIGDTDADMDAGRAAGAKTILIQAEYNIGIPCNWAVPDILSAVELIKNLEAK